MEVLHPVGETLVGEQLWNPAVGEATGEFRGLRAEGGHVDGRRVVRYRPLVTQPAYVEYLAVVVHVTTRVHLADDVDGLAEAAERPVERLGVPALRDGGRTRPEAQPKAAVGHVVHRERALAHDGRRARVRREDVVGDADIFRSLRDDC